MLALASNLALGTGDFGTNFIYACVDSATGTPAAAAVAAASPAYGKG